MDHTDECQEARQTHARPGDDTPDWPPLKWLTPQARAAVLACPHWSHDTARFIVGQG